MDDWVWWMIAAGVMAVGDGVTLIVTCVAMLVAKSVLPLNVASIV